MKEIPKGWPTGGWDSEVGFLARAELALTRAGAARAAFDQRWTTDESVGESKDARLRFFKDFRTEFRLYADAAVLFSALAVEAVLNFYGVAVLTEEFFTRNFERMSPDKKLAAVIGVRRGIALDPSDEIMRVVVQLATLRNQLAHPKTKEIRDDLQVKRTHERLKDAETAVELARRFRDLLIQLDPDAQYIAASA